MIERGLLAGAPMIRIMPLVAAVMVAMLGDARAQNCQSLSGPARTDCFIARARMFGQQSDVAAGEAQQRADEAFFRAATGTSSARTSHRAKPKHKAVPP